LYVIVENFAKNGKAMANYGLVTFTSY